MDDLKGNENRARQEKAGVYNRMTPYESEYRAPSPNEPPPPLRGDAPMMLDPHARGRHSVDNLSVKPGEKSRSSYAAEDRRRLRPSSGDTYR
jgi:hypothetical protein